MTHLPKQPSEKPRVTQTSLLLPHPIQPQNLADSPTKVSPPRAASVSPGLTPPNGCTRGFCQLLTPLILPLKPTPSHCSENNHSQLQVSSFLHLLREFGEHLLCVRY